MANTDEEETEESEEEQQESTDGSPVRRRDKTKKRSKLIAKNYTLSLEVMNMFLYEKLEKLKKGEVSFDKMAPTELRGLLEITMFCTKKDFPAKTNDKDDDKEGIVVNMPDLPDFVKEMIAKNKGKRH